MRSTIILALLFAVCSAQNWNVESFRGPQSQGFQFSFSQCFGLARRSRQTRVDIPSLYNTRTGRSVPVPQLLYTADQSIITKLENDGWVVRTRRTMIPQIVYERVPVCCSWDQNCDQSQPNDAAAGSNEPCINGGQLIYTDGKQACQCPPGFSGLWCQEKSGRQEPTPNFPTGPVIRLASTSGQYMDQAINDAELMKRQLMAMTLNGNTPVEMMPPTPYSQGAALWHQQALRAKLSEMENMYSRGYQDYHPRKRQCLNCVRVSGLPVRAYRPYVRQRVSSSYIPTAPAARPYYLPTVDKYITSKAGQYIPMRTGQYVPTRSSQYIPTRSSQYIPTRTGQYIPSRTSQYIPKRTGQYIPTRASQYIPTRTGKYFPIIRRGQYIPIRTGQYIPTRDSQFIPRTMNYFTQAFKSMTSPRPMSKERNPHHKVKSSGQMPPITMEAARFIQQGSDIPFSNQNNPYSNLPPQVPNYLPGARMPEARTPWDLDPFNQQQNPGFMNDPRVANPYNKRRQLLALAVFKELMNQRRAQLLRLKQESLEQTRTTTPELNTIPPLDMEQIKQCQVIMEPKVKECFMSQDLTLEQFMSPVFMEKSRQLCQNSSEVSQCIQKLEDMCGETSKKVTDSIVRVVGLICEHIKPTVVSESVPIQQAVQQTLNETVNNSGNTESQDVTAEDNDQSIPTAEEQQQMRQCQGVLEPLLNDCIKQHQVSLEQFMSPEYMNRAAGVCQESISIGQCIKKLENACGQTSIKTTRKMLNSILGMMGMVCQQIESRGGLSNSQPVQEQTMTQTSQQKSENTVSNQQEAQGYNQQEIPAPEELQGIQQCQPVLESGLNECLKSYDLTLQQFVNPQFIDKARKACISSVGECIMKLGNSCADSAINKKMLASIFRMMNIVCQQIQHGAENSAQQAGELKQQESSKDAPNQATNEQPQTNPTQEAPPTQEEYQQMQQCQPLLVTKINECLKSYDLTIEQFNDPQFVEKSRKLCQNYQPLGQCLEQLDKTCGESFITTTRKVIKFSLDRIGMVCQQIKSVDQANTNGQPQSNHNEAPKTQEITQVTPEMLLKCQTSLAPKVDECLKDYSITLEQFANPELREKSAQVCQNSQTVSQCIKNLDTACGPEVTKKILGSVLNMMGMVCHSLKGQGNVPTSQRGGPMLRAGPKSTPTEKAETIATVANENKQEDSSKSMTAVTNDEKQLSGESSAQRAAQQPNTEETMKYLSRDLELFGYPLWLMITLILILVILALLFVMVVCLCLRRKRKQRKVVITKECLEKPPLPDDKLCAIGIPPPSYTITAVQQNEDGFALPPIDLGEDTVSVTLDETTNEKPPLEDKDNKAGKY